MLEKRDKMLMRFLKGICVGIANVIPGFSGATMAIIVNVYNEFVNSFADMLSHPITVIKKSWDLYLGIFVGVLLALFTIVKLLEVATLITILFFVGLIIGSIPSLYKEKVHIRPFKISYLLTFVFTLAIIIGLPFVSENVVSNIEINFITLIVIALMGIISASAMVIPGVSGSMALMIFGYYALIMNSIKDFIESFIILDFTNLLSLFLILFSFGVGIILGVVGISKVIKFVYDKYENVFHIGVLGLLLASPFAIVYTTYTSYQDLFNVNIYTWIIAVFMLLVGILFSYITSKDKL